MLLCYVYKVYDLWDFLQCLKKHTEKMYFLSVSRKLWNWKLLQRLECCKLFYTLPNLFRLYEWCLERNNQGNGLSHFFLLKWFNVEKVAYWEKTIFWPLAMWITPLLIKWSTSYKVSSTTNQFIYLVSLTSSFTE